MTEKEYLLQARYLDERIHSKLQQIESLNDLATSCSAVISELLHLMVKSSVAQNKTSRDTIQLDFLQKACKVA